MLISHRFKLNKGMTLIELVMSIVIIGIALMGTILAFNTAARFSGNPVVEHQKVAIAKAYLDEILIKNYPGTVPCGTPPANRADYSNICDYNNLTDNGAKDSTGASISGFENYIVTVIIDTAGAQLGSLVSGTQVVRVDVTVKLTGDTQGYTLSGYKTNI